MGLIIHSRPFRKVFVKRNPVLKQQQTIFGFVKFIRKQNILKKRITMSPQISHFKNPHFRNHYRNPHFKIPYENVQSPRYANKFEYINLKSQGNIPKTIVTNMVDYEKYSDFQIQPIPTEVLHDDVSISNLLNVYWFLYNNGGIYLNKKINVHPSIFIKNDFIGVNIDLFSCVKDSIVMKKIIDDAYIIIVEEGTMNDLSQSFYKNIEDYRFNKSINFLI